MVLEVVNGIPSYDKYLYCLGTVTLILTLAVKRTHITSLFISLHQLPLAACIRGHSEVNKRLYCAPRSTIALTHCALQMNGAGWAPHCPAKDQTKFLSSVIHRWWNNLLNSINIQLLTFHKTETQT